MVQHVKRYGYTTTKTEKQISTHIMGLIDRGVVIQDNSSRMLVVDLKLSDWLFDVIQNNQVLTLHRDYFRLKKPLERRLYEIARKHCGNKLNFKISLNILKDKVG